MIPLDSMIDRKMDWKNTNKDGSPLRGGIKENTIDFEQDFSLTSLKLMPEDKFS